jgi:hypothetical protein
MSERESTLEGSSGVIPTMTLRPGRYLLLMGSVTLFVPGPTVAAIVAARQYLYGVPSAASEGFFWLAAALIPFALLLATWLLPRRLAADQRAVEIVTPGRNVPLAVYDDIRIVGVWTMAGITTVAVVAGVVLSWTALTDCSASVGSCGSPPHRSFVISALILAGGELFALAGVRLISRLSLFRERPSGNARSAD